MLVVIVWGTKIKRKPLGWVADWCPICRRVQPHRLVRVGAAGHLYYLSIGKGKLVGHEVECAECHVVLDADREAFDAVAPEPGEDVERLERETYTRLRDHYDEAISRAARAASFTPDERQQEIEFVLQVLNAQIERHKEDQPMTPGGRWAVRVTFVCFLLFIGSTIAYAKDGGRFWTDAMIAFAVLMGAGLVSVIVFMGLRGPWF